MYQLSAFRNYTSPKGFMMLHNVRHTVVPSFKTVSFQAECVFPADDISMLLVHWRFHYGRVSHFIHRLQQGRRKSRISRLNGDQRYRY